MSLYNAIFGTNKLAPLLLKLLDIDQPNGKWVSGRFRDIYLNEDGSKITICARNGGGNREDYFPDNITKHPNYLKDYDDDFDSTYAYIEFSVPEAFEEIAKLLATGEEPENVSDKFQNLVNDIEAKKETPETKRALEIGKQIFTAIKEAKKCN